MGSKKSSSGQQQHQQVHGAASGLLACGHATVTQYTHHHCPGRPTASSSAFGSLS